MKYLLTITLSCLLIFSCSEDDDNSSPSGNNNNNSSQADMISSSLILPSGAEQVSGGLPAAADPQNAPTLFLSDSTIDLQGGGSSSIGGSYGNAKRRLGGASVQVSGASFHYKVPVQVTANPNDSTNGSFSFQLGLEAGAATEDVVINMNIYDSEKVDYYSEAKQIVLKVPESSEPGDTTDLIVSLYFNDNNNQQTLFVVDPSGDTLTYTNQSVPSGGYFIRDLADAAIWDNAPNGNYTVLAEHEGVTTDTTYVALDVTAREVQYINDTLPMLPGQKRVLTFFTYSNGEVLF